MRATIVCRAKEIIYTFGRLTFILTDKEAAGSKRAAEPTAGERIGKTCYCHPGTDGAAAVFVVCRDGEGVKHCQK